MEAVPVAIYAGDSDDLGSVPVAKVIEDETESTRITTTNAGVFATAVPPPKKKPNINNNTSTFSYPPPPTTTSTTNTLDHVLNGYASIPNSTYARPTTAPPPASSAAETASSSAHIAATGRNILSNAYANEPVSANNKRQKLLLYQELQQNIFNNRGIRQQVSTKENTIRVLQTNLNSTIIELKDNRKAQPYMEKRLHRNAHPRFLHYFQLNREAKVKRLEGELQDLRNKENVLVSNENTLRRDLERETAELTNLKTREQNYLAYVNQCANIFKQIVDSAPPTQHMQLLEREIVTNEQQIQKLVTQVASVNNVAKAMQYCADGFARARANLQEAASMNMGAGFVNMLQSNQDQHGFNMSNIAERMAQARRDQLLNSAKTTAINASMQWQPILDQFPYDIRAAMPDLTRGLDRARVPDLRGANFMGTMAVGWAFGRMGDFGNDIYAGSKINENLNQLNQCAMEVQQQMGLVLQVLNRLNERIQSLRNHRKEIDRQMEEERALIFTSEMSQVV